MGNQANSNNDDRASEIDYLTKQRRRKQEEMAVASQVAETGKSVYARSESGNIIRSASSGRGVTSSYGRTVVDEYRAARDGASPSYGGQSEAQEDSSDNDSPVSKPKADSKPADISKSSGLGVAARKLIGSRISGSSTRKFYG